jgi:hypothetical protein
MKQRKPKKVRLIESHAFRDRKFRIGATAMIVKVLPSGKVQVRFHNDERKTRVVPSGKILLFADDSTTDYKRPPKSVARRSAR